MKHEWLMIKFAFAVLVSGHHNSVTSQPHQLPTAQHHQPPSQLVSQQPPPPANNPSDMSRIQNFTPQQQPSCLQQMAAAAGPGNDGSWGGRCFAGHPGVMNTRDCFEKAYKIHHVLGKGGFGIVYAGIRNADSLQVAVKHIAKAKIKDWGQVRQC